MSWLKKIAWVGGNQLPPDLDPQTTVADLLDMSDVHPFNISNTDEISVVLVPQGENALLLPLTSGSSEPVEEGTEVPLEITLKELSVLAGNIARQLTRKLIETVDQKKDFLF